MDATVNVNNIQWGIEIAKAFKEYVINGNSIPAVINVELPMIDKTNVTEFMDRAKEFETKYSK
jgi:ABC-type sugar transport system substrate-binding protein